MVYQLSWIRGRFGFGRQIETKLHKECCILFVYAELSDEGHLFAFMALIGGSIQYSSNKEEVLLFIDLFVLNPRRTCNEKKLRSLV